MKSIIAYFSQTENTKRIARAIHKGMSELVEQCDIARLTRIDYRDLSKYDLIGLGSPVWNGVPTHVRRFINTMPRLPEKHSFAFCTHGTKPERFFPSVVRLLGKRGLIVIGTRDWYGSVNHPLLPKPYLTDGHPDEIDLREAGDFGKEMVELSRRISAGETELIPPLPPMPPPRTLSRPRTKLKLNVEKCRYPECRLCMDNCRLKIIDLSVSPPIFPKSCQPCYFCELICPEGAIEADYESNSKLEIGRAKRIFTEALDKAEAEGRFRRLVPKADIGWNTPYYKVYNKHPRYVIPEEDCEGEH
ncbi:MAG: hypothetical protein JSW12_10230 [Deltaproteobacteria bacterium]|nr:MAG: hypothetical protein JSW12_10230 [Deltaproteobacteria bacterium]